MVPRNTVDINFCLHMRVCNLEFADFHNFILSCATEPAFPRDPQYPPP